jgi:hypothetical protein
VLYAVSNTTRKQRPVLLFSAMSHIMARCQSVIQNCQSALECHDCTMFETWANLNDKVKAVVDLSCHIEPVTSCDLVCHLPRDVVCLLKQHGFIRPRPGKSYDH